VVEVSIPPLRDRGADVRRLALHLASGFARRQGRDVQAISRRALERLEAYPWPGNVRELRNVMDRAVTLTRGDVIKSSALRLGVAAPNAAPRAEVASAAADGTNASLAEVEAAHITRVLRSVDGHQSKAAKILGIHRNTLGRKLREYEIDASGAGT
jgi:Nif-specific regulatory protein